MKKIFLFLLLVPAFLFAQTHAGFVIDGKADGYPDNTVVKLYKNGEGVEFLTTKILKGKFQLKGSVGEPVLCFLTLGDERPVELYVEDANISFKVDKNKPGEAEVKGSATHADFSSFTSTFVPEAIKLNGVAQQVNMLVPGASRDSLLAVYNAIQAGLQNQIDAFVKSRPKSLVAPFILDITYQFNEDVMKLEERFNKLDASVRKSPTGKELQGKIGERKIGAVGTEALDFSQPDTAGVSVSLSSFRGKYVLVDFWASWCGPCRNENPNVVRNFEKFRDKNFSILGVSLDRPGQKDRWLEAIHEDGLTWTHVSDLQFWENAAAKLYHIGSIPQNLLLDPQGKIIGKNLRGPALEAKLCEIFGCN